MSTPTLDAGPWHAADQRATLLSDYRQAERALVAAQAHLHRLTRRQRNASTPDDPLLAAQETLKSARRAYYMAQDAYHTLPPEPDPAPVPTAADRRPLVKTPASPGVRTVTRGAVQTAEQT